MSSLGRTHVENFTARKNRHLPVRMLTKIPTTMVVSVARTEIHWYETVYNFSTPSLFKKQNVIVRKHLVYGMTYLN